MQLIKETATFNFVKENLQNVREIKEFLEKYISRDILYYNELSKPHKRRSFVKNYENQEKLEEISSFYLENKELLKKAQNILRKELEYLREKHKLRELDLDKINFNEPFIFSFSANFEKGFLIETTSIKLKDLRFKKGYKFISKRRIISDQFYNNKFINNFSKF